MSDKRTTPLGRLSRQNRTRKPGGKAARATEKTAAATTAEETKPASEERDLAAESFLQEVSEEVRKEKLFALFRQYGPYAIGAIVALVVSAAVLEWRAASTEEAAREAGGALLAADEVEGGPLARADALLNAAPANAEGLSPRLVAEFRAAERRSEAGDLTGALELLDRIAARASLPQIYRDLAVLKAAMLEIDSADPDGLLNRLEPLTGDDRAFRPLALETIAAARLRLDDVDGAREALADALSSPNAPQGLQARAGQLLEALGGPLEAREIAPVGGAASQDAEE